jgi:hypothetical protein
MRLTSCETDRSQINRQLFAVSRAIRNEARLVYLEENTHTLPASSARDAIPMQMLYSLPTDPIVFIHVRKLSYSCDWRVSKTWDELAVDLAFTNPSYLPACGLPGTDLLLKKWYRELTECLRYFPGLKTLQVNLTNALCPLGTHPLIIELFNMYNSNQETSLAGCINRSKLETLDILGVCSTHVRENVKTIMSSGAGGSRRPRVVFHGMLTLDLELDENERPQRVWDMEAETNSAAYQFRKFRPVDLLRPHRMELRSHRVSAGRVGLEFS